MKKIILYFSCVLLFSSCQQGRPDIVKDFVDAINRSDFEDIRKLTTEDFVYNENDTLSKKMFLAKLDSLKIFEYESSILTLQNYDSIVKTEEQVRSIVDSLLEVTPIIVQHKTYRFLNEKVASVIVDSTLNAEEYSKDFQKKMNALSLYAKEQYGQQDDKEFATNLKKYLMEFKSLPLVQRKEYIAYGNLQGTFISRNCAFYKKLIFRGKKTVTIIDAIFGMSFTSSYELDENYVRIRTDKSDLLFEIKDAQTLIGEGFAKGTFKKVK